jgi:capsular polysaccharide biosynthesis protein
MQVSVRDPDPVLAMRIANSTAKVFSQKAVELMNIPNVNIIDHAILPENPVTPTKMRNMAVSVFAALMLAAAVVFGIEFLDNTIKSEEDVEKRLGLTVLGTIPDLNMK